jgi:DNA-binding NarL/FixJ family response regulator
VIIGKNDAIRVLIADDHKIVREGIANMLNRERRIAVVGHAADGLEAVAKVRQLHPQVVVMDVNMPRMNGEEATRAIKNEFPQVRIIGLSMRDEPETARMMLTAGASAYLNKTGDPDQLIHAILENVEAAD